MKKMNVSFIVHYCHGKYSFSLRLEFEIVYFKAAVQHFNHYDSPLIVDKHHLLNVLVQAGFPSYISIYIYNNANLV